MIPQTVPQMLQSALFYHNEGLNVIPVVYRDKKPALPTWEEYHTRMSTEAELREWFGGSTPMNLGVVHGAVSGNYIAIDIDHDAGILESIRAVFPEMLGGRVEQSGSREGYHIPLRLKTLPDFGMDNRQKRPRGNKTWKCDLGAVNIRAQFCQTLLPPSLHKTGNRYCFLQKGQLVELDNLDRFIWWLDQLAPPKTEKAPTQTRKHTQRGNPNNLMAAALSAWPSVMDVFREFGRVRDTAIERNGEIRVLGNGGLLVTEDERKFYNFSDEMGGGIIQAWAWCRFGHYDEGKHLEQCLTEMALAAGIDPTQFEDIEPIQKTISTPPRKVWAQEYGGMWKKLRVAAA